jgi:hypothetical protein
MKSTFLDDLDHASRRQLHAPIYDILQFTRPWGFSLRDVHVPIRFWHGDADPILRVRAGEGHIGNLDAAHEVLDAILSLWDGAPGPDVREAGTTTPADARESR